MNEKPIRRIFYYKTYYLDFFDAFVGPIERELQVRSTHRAGRAHGMGDQSGYTARINATNFALANDDGSTRDYAGADVILVGVSRSGKTPTCLYMALQYGIFAANYPLTDEDLEHPRLPQTLVPHRAKLYGLTIRPDRLQQIRDRATPIRRVGMGFGEFVEPFREVDPEHGMTFRTIIDFGHQFGESAHAREVRRGRHADKRKIAKRHPFRQRKNPRPDQRTRVPENHREGRVLDQLV